jgi:hypothetical protein
MLILSTYKFIEMFVKIPNYICYISLPVFLILNLACHKFSVKEQLVIDYLNKNEKTFDRESFHLVELTLQDTIMAHEIYKISDIPGFRTEEYYGDISDWDLIPVIDSAWADGYVPPRTIDWEEEDYPVKLYSTLKDEREYTVSYNYQIIKDFFNKKNIVSMKDFERELMNNTVFVDSLQVKMGYYTEPFSGCFDSDSLKKYIGISKIKRETLYGYLYLLKFRTKDELKTRKLLFNSKNQILGHKAIEN